MCFVFEVNVRYEASKVKAEFPVLISHSISPCAVHLFVVSYQFSICLRLPTVWGCVLKYKDFFSY